MAEFVLFNHYGIAYVSGGFGRKFDRLAVVFFPALVPVVAFDGPYLVPTFLVGRSRYSSGVVTEERAVVAADRYARRVDTVARPRVPDVNVVKTPVFSDSSLAGVRFHFEIAAIC